MAIAKMKNVTIISTQAEKEELLRAIQTLQSVELVDVSSKQLEEQGATPSYHDLSNEIKELEQEWQAISDDVAYAKSNQPSKGMLASFRDPIRTLTLQELESEAERVKIEGRLDWVRSVRKEQSELQQRIRSLKDELVFLEKWKNLTYLPQKGKSGTFIKVLTGTVPQTTSDEAVRRIRSADELVSADIFQTKEEYGISIAYDVTDEQAVYAILTENRFTELDYPYEAIPSNEMKRVEESIKLASDRSKELLKEVKDDQALVADLSLLVEATYAKLARRYAQNRVHDTSNLFVLQGWLEEKKVRLLHDVLQRHLDSSSYVVQTSDVEKQQENDVPIVLENNHFVAPFESITKMYSMPKYTEIDPTPFLMPFYFVFFGMMMADAGYGLLMFLVTTAVIKFLPVKPATKKSMKFFQLLGIATIIWGIIFGSFFGLELPFVFLSIMDDVNLILILSVVFGVIQILLGLGIKTYLLIRDNDWYGAISDGFGWLTIFAGIILLVVSNFVFPVKILGTIGGITAIFGAVSIIVASALASKNKALGAGAGLYNLYGITSYVGDIVSYTRLMALGVSGGSIGLAFNMIIDFLPPAAKFTVGILLFIVLHAVNLGLSALSAYVHGARLMFVEFFGKFYEGGGKELEPLKAKEEYIILKNNIKQ